ncbi:uncharacterized protein LOC129322928 [Prosopis cineraria]|uniref:uncharacterized protein LOC129322928 n=1 Tax=Prosopis cineraria TaxID=364024 RepID=UPI00240FFC58|nr:uncharacterized protein LOC129322928 [Prosopis cineraria]
MATKNVFLFKTQFDSINTWFLKELLHKNMIWLLGSLRLFLCNYVVCLFGVILNFVSSFHVGGDGKTERYCEIDGFREELTNFLFQNHEDVFEDLGIGGEKTQSSLLIEDIFSDVDDEKEKVEGGTLLMEGYREFQENKKEEETESSVSMEVHSDSHEINEKKTETEIIVPEDHFDEAEKCVSQEVQFDQPEDGKKKETKSESSISLNVHCDLPGNKKEGEIESPVSMEAHFDIEENEGKEESKSSVLMEVQSHHLEGEERETSCVLMEANSATTTQKYQYVSDRDISGFLEEPTSMRFTFQEFFVGPNVPVISDNNAKIISQKQETSEQTQANKLLGCNNNSQKGLESESLIAARGEISEESGKPEEKERSYEEQDQMVHRENKAEEWRKMMEQLEHEVGNEWRMEWEHDDVVEQLKIELRNARQGGLSTIIEEQEEDDDDDEEEEEEGETGETEHAEEVGDQNLQNNQENEELKDQMDELEEVYQIYEEKMRKLDILNYQTMHGLGLLQLKDSAKSSFKGLKPLISQSLWPRKEPKSSPLMKLVQELQRDLEVVYVGQVCLSWEMLCWLHKKALQLIKQFQNHSSQVAPPQFNVAAGEFQLFQVLLQRFVENEAFQGPRTLNFVKNRCVIRNLLQVPAIRDDSAKERNITKGDQEYVVSSARLAEIIKESMRLFWKFVRADKEDVNLILKVSQPTRTVPSRDPAIFDLVKDIRAHLHKKEKKLKDLVRSGNCIVRKFQKHQQQEDQLNHEQLLAQVELKLVSRVLNMSKLRKEHIIWCNEKLRRIKFVMKKKKVVVEPSFLLFPC